MWDWETDGAGFRNRVFVRSTETSLLHVRYVFSQGRNLGWYRRQAGCWVWLVGWVSVWRRSADLPAVHRRASRWFFGRWKSGRPGCVGGYVVCVTSGRLSETWNVSSQVFWVW
ncbi:hypothetical protein CCHR01_12791 [Colletotrichum chrysophilum]|uniref:Uncharacterized protein n=1 Tax=Colletotrichum chrysophilum TaxID=1836956 RepID=A0AAD9EH62_9PEZI|nr:hypothetical protein CCHR01_12791 [Colletotrichum chrysophilum]